jgi:hypothetical protein
MPLKKIAIAKKSPGGFKGRRSQAVLDTRKPGEALRVVHAMHKFLGAVCVEILDYEPKDICTEGATMSLNKIFEGLQTLKADRDAWRTRCQSIEAVFNAHGSQSSGGAEHGK